MTDLIDVEGDVAGDVKGARRASEESVAPEVLDPRTPDPRMPDPRMPDPRMTARRKSVSGAKFRRRRRLLGALVGVIVLALAVPAVLRSRVVDLDHITIIGTSSVDATQVAEMAGVKIGDPIVFLDAERIAGRLRSQARFSRVAVQVRFPSTLEVRLTDRQTIARVTGPKFSVIAGERGVVIDLALSDASLPTVQMVDDPPIKSGARLPDDVADAVDLLGSMPTSRKADVERVLISAGGQYTFKLTNNRTVLFGTIDEADAKLRSMEGMLDPAKVDNDNVCQLDVRVPASPTVRRAPACDPPPAVAPPVTPAVTPAVTPPAIEPAAEPAAVEPAVAPTTVPAAG